MIYATLRSDNYNNKKESGIDDWSFQFQELIIKSCIIIVAVILV